MFSIILVKFFLQKKKQQTPLKFRLPQRVNDFANSQKLMFWTAINTDDTLV